MCQTLAFQMVVLEACGFAVRNISVIHVNNQYVREGIVDPIKITSTTDITDAVKAKRTETLSNIDAALAMLNSGTHPSLSPSLASADGFVEWLEIYKHLTSAASDSIYNLCALKPHLVEILEQDQIIKIADIPEDIDLLPKQELQVESARLGGPIISKEKIKEYLNTFSYPLYFLDYETFASIVPYFDGLKPYQQVPFQYSLHVIDSPGAELRHMDYLHRENTNPVEELSKTLQSQVGTTGTVVTWNMSFEKSCNILLGRLVPEYSDFYEQFNERIVDLMLPFSRCWYVDKGFYGSASIKHVLPVLVPELSYMALDIHEGSSAQRLWMEAVLDGKRDEEKENILNNLVEYCGLDTLAMVVRYGNF